MLAIMGPTASGKTGLALALAQRYPLEIISVDSALIYRGMDIGTAKPSEQELVQVPHHLIDILDPDQRYSAADFVADCKALVAQIHQRGRLPVLVGGTMMYFHALQQGLADLPSADDALRARLMLDYQRDSQAMHDRLACVDPQSAQRIHANDPQRLIRALEIYHLTGEPLSVLQARQVKAGWDVKLCKLALIPQDRQRLHQRIAQRLEQMFAQDFINEVALLYSQPGLHADLPSIRCVGYRQVWDYLRGEYDQRTAFEKSLVATRQLAKRQLTWLRKEQDVVVIDPFVLSQAQQLATIESLLNLGE
ncbi:tRNA (adenosine(37)-N6)-dimethylallyltransferase MiaA [Thiomicrospira microaerophila]|uniref:tRNA (adenosine(37)-N6)-dimethylallyltransferase MiaA n=1 Tax=Thiomicrospira microaerophila TaxID=406020 RepID=UPI0022B76563|nr:tRNA (adenosine(37)-N6)-dimethylallyltransferase MiaA [Thiomicrospira microaerophila]